MQHTRNKMPKKSVVESKRIKDRRQYSRLFLSKNQGGLSRKIIAEYEAIYGKEHRRKECES